MRDSLYKYLTASVMLDHVLPTSSMRWSSPLVFNDPFDCQTDPQPDRHTPITLTSLQKGLEEIVFDESMAVATQFEMAIRHLRSFRASPQEQQRQITHYASSLLHSYRTSPLQSLHEFARRVRLLCMSEHFDCIPMWSHYAAQHTGAAIEFDTRALVRDYPVGPLCKVSYDPGPPLIEDTASSIIDSIKGTTKELDIDQGKKMFTTKSQAWRSEQEWRFVYLPDVENDGLHLIRPYPPNAIKSIVLGCRFAGVDYVRLTSLLGQSHYSHVRVRRLFPSRSQFLLEETSTLHIPGMIMSESF